MEAGLQEQKSMKCFICNQAETVTGTTAVLFERGQLSLTIKAVPARICPICGEAYTEESVAANLLQQAEELAKAGMKVELREYTRMEDR
jgi:YgiT-type zinc finger domain-containing protein